ncbi:eukaryotic translation initiation factor 2-alpha kinase 1-like isoform X2 [Dreissena polymorpha]|uniref:eukaryotic translation initiation factor 2-alpha kinase 1-like isoform X2 n=1 Tax=Dreissena polymorpha TaxID=45954 RepID=UPI002263DC22|nr:eukaryotic translation initiation factor 2-alpha kinase 1-like isoform X2 [Dreissena polymorpha]
MTMDKIRNKIKKPGRIENIDDSDLLEFRRSSEGAPSSSVSSKAVLPRSVPNHLLFISILEQLCTMYSRDTKQAQDVFRCRLHTHTVFRLLCEQLERLHVVSPVLRLDEMSSLRAQYRHSVHRMLVAALHKSNSIGKNLSLAAPGHIAPLNSLHPQPSCGPESFINQTSRYETEFVEIEKIGRGGFGSVYKSRNKLDGKLYAVKVVKFKHSKPENIFRVLREAKALANLQHTNIVGYNSCWLEYGPKPAVPRNTSLRAMVDGDQKSDSSSDDGIVFKHDVDTVDILRPLGKPITNGPKIKEINSNCSSLATSPQTEIFRSPPKWTLNVRETEQEFSITESASIFQMNRSVVSQQCSNMTSSLDPCSQSYMTVSQYSQDSRLAGRKVEFEIESHSDSIEMDGSASPKRQGRSDRVYTRSISCDPYVSGEVNAPKTNLIKDFNESDFPLKTTVKLYIQMELCGLTLKDWMQERNYKLSPSEMVARTSQNMNIFKQILKAVDYIHSQGIMHRDLKPRNIFLMENENNCVKVGDFGLATDDILSSPVSCSSSFYDLEAAATRLVRTASVLSDHTTGVGTSTYAAPEQLESSMYNAKCDVYSLGVILFELFQVYGTEMERHRSIADLRNGTIPEATHTNWPVQTRFIQLMTNPNPEVRPSARDMLQGELFVSKDQIIAEMKAKEVDYVRTIECLKKQVQERDEIIQKLLDALKIESLPT